MNPLVTPNELEIQKPMELPVGFLFASIKNIGLSAATVNNTILASGEAKSYPFVGKGYETLEIDPEDSTLLVMYIL